MDGCIVLQFYSHLLIAWMYMLQSSPIIWGGAALHLRILDVHHFYTDYYVLFV